MTFRLSQLFFHPAALAIGLALPEMFFSQAAVFFFKKKN